MRKNLSELRKKCGLTQMEVAERLQINQTTISKWENGEALPRADMLFTIALLYGVKVDEINLNRVRKVKKQSCTKDESFTGKASTEAGGP